MSSAEASLGYPGTGEASAGAQPGDAGKRGLVVTLGHVAGRQISRVS